MYSKWQPHYKRLVNWENNMVKLWVRYDADDYTYEVVEGRDTVICKTNTEKEAKELIMKGIK